MTITYGIHIFRRDLRTTDNIALWELSKVCDKIIPVFFLDKQQIVINSKNKHYFSYNAVQFMCKCLEDLDEQVGGNLLLLYGSPKVCLQNILAETSLNITHVSFNSDFSKYAKKRDKSFVDIINNKKSKNVSVIQSDDDFTLTSLKDLGLSTKKWYKQYGAFAKLAKKHTPVKEISLKPMIPKDTFVGMKSNSHLRNTTIYVNELQRKFYTENENIAQIGGRKVALHILNNIIDHKNYNNTRDMLATPTTRISGYLNFGCVSTREMYNTIKMKLGSTSQITDQLFWRDFWLQILRFAPNGDKYKHIDDRFDNDIQWRTPRNDQQTSEEWKALMSGSTGYLLIDAGMREMITTGFMHNRARMLVVMFWTKYLGINIFDPIYGSQVGFSKHLLDAVGGSQNKMNHQWSTELDFPGRKYACKEAPLSGRPMDISNRAIKRFDPDGNYVRQWIPVLKDVPINELVKWDKDMYNKYKLHVPPVFDNPKERYEEWCELCRKNN